MKKRCAVAMTAGFLLAGAALPASAQVETIKVGGVVFFDHNGNEAFDAGEPVRADSPGVWVRNLDDDNKVVGEFPTDANGRYEAVLPKGPRYLVIKKDVEGYGGPLGARVVQADTTLDFPLWGRFISGHAFVDANGDGAKQPGERTLGGRVLVTGETSAKKPVKVETEIAADGSYHVELPEGDYRVTAPDLTRQGLAIAKPQQPHDVDWLTREAKVLTPISRIDLRYFEPKADSAVEDIAVTPAKDTYTVGEQIDVRFKLANKGDVPGVLRFVLFGPDAKLLSHSNNISGANGDFTTLAKVLPGDSFTVELKFELTKAGAIEVWPFAHPYVDGHKDVDRSNQGARIKKTINVVEKYTATTTPPTTASPSETTAPTTTTTQAVAKAGTKSGLASTGASPLGFLALGAVLLAAGVSVFFVARRRRS